MKPIKKILIVCTGNSCRSIMAEGYLSQKLNEAGLKDIIIISAGTSAVSGLKPTDETIQVMKESGVDVSSYISSSLSKTQIENADIILVMEPRHKDLIFNMAPAAQNKIHLLRKFYDRDNNGDSINDPIGRPIEFYREIFQIIKNSIDGFVNRLQKKG